MADGISDFARRIELRAEQVGESADKLVRKASLAIDQAVVLGTPVDTGRARSNWLVSVGAPRGDVIKPYSSGSNLGKEERANAQGAIQQGSFAISQRKPGQDVFISNNVPYVGTLNRGSSRQAPAQFVEMAILAGVNAVKGVKLLGN